MKWRRILLRLGLVTMILTSFYLSYLIWLNPSNKTPLLPTGSSELANKQTSSKEEVNTKSQNDIFLPLKLVSVTNSVAQETSSEAIMKKVVKVLESGEMTQAEVIVYPTNDAFLEHSVLKNGIELSFMNEVLMNEAIDVMGLKLELPNQLQEKKLTYEHVQYDFDTNKIYFLDTVKHTKVVATFSLKPDKIHAILKEESIPWVHVIYNPSLLASQYITNEPVDMKLYSYISSVQPYTVFRDSFFKNPINARSTDDSSDLIITDRSEAMTVQKDNRFIEYRDSNLVGFHNNLYTKGYEYIRELGMNYGNLRFLDRNGETMNYRVFVEGYPVFSQNNEGLISMEFAENVQANSWSVRIGANMNTIQIPIPSDQTTKLPSSQEILMKLKNRGADLSKISSILIGYKWSDIQDTNVVDLVPTWYLNINHTWVDADSLLKKLSEGEGDK